MVSIRKPPGQRGGTGSAGASLTKLLTLRNALIAFIAFQCVSLLYKVGQRRASVTKKPLSLLDVTTDYHRRQQLLRGGGSEQQQLNTNNESHDAVAAEVKKVQHVEQEHANEHLTDADDHVTKDHHHHPDHHDEPKQPTQPQQHRDVVVEIEKKEEHMDVVEPHHDAPVHEEHDELVAALLHQHGEMGGGGGGELNQRALQKLGSGPETKLGYVLDFVDHRLHPQFRQDKVTLLSASNAADHAARVATLLGESQVQPCHSMNTTTGHITQASACQQHVMAYNPSITLTRYMCGQKVPPLQAIRLDEPCPVRLFEQVATVTGDGMPPVVVYSGHNNDVAAAHDTIILIPVPPPPSQLETITCPIPCQHQRDMPENVHRYIAGTSWKLMYSWQDPYTQPDLKVERSAFKTDHYYATTNLLSDVPLSTYSFTSYPLRNTQALDWHSAGNKATYLLDSNCLSGTSRRQKWFAAVDAVMETESYGRCHHNTELDEHDTLDTMAGRLKVARKNRIQLAFEANTEKYHFTAITWEALMSGAVPALVGPPNMAAVLPPNAGIYSSNFNSWDKFAAAVKEVSDDRSKWASYQTWRTNITALDAFAARFNFTRTSPECRTCQWAYAKQYGLGWHHEQQMVQEPRIGRQLCVDDSVHKLVQYPFRENWSRAAPLPPLAATKPSGRACRGIDAAPATRLDLGRLSIMRSVVYHDGIVDMIIIGAEGSTSGRVTNDVVLRLEFDVHNLEGALFLHVHTLVPATDRTPFTSSGALQDNNVKVTVLANWSTELRSPTTTEGVLEVVLLRAGELVLRPTDVRTIRVITEDVNVVHDKLTEYHPSSFAQLAMQDFLAPIQLFSAGAAVAAR